MHSERSAVAQPLQWVRYATVVLEMHMSIIYQSLRCKHTRVEQPTQVPRCFIHLLHSQWTSESPNTSLGMSMQWRWYQTWQESHSDPFFLACDMSSGAPLSLAFSGHSLSLAQHRKTRNLAILKTSYQMWPDLTVIKPNTARVQATAYVKCIGYDQNPAVRTIGTTLGANDN